MTRFCCVKVLFPCLKVFQKGNDEDEPEEVQKPKEEESLYSKNKVLKEKNASFFCDSFFRVDLRLVDLLD